MPPVHSARLPPVSAMRPRLAGARLPKVVALLIMTFFIPEAISVVVFDFRLTPARLLLLVLTPMLIGAFAGLIGSRQYRFVLSDLFMPIAAGWMVLAPAMIEDLMTALKSGGIMALEFVGPYLVARCLVQTPSQIHAAIKILCICAAIVGPIAILDTIANYAVVHDELARLTGYTYSAVAISLNLDDMHRLGLYRAQGVFEHPILFGVAMCYSLMLIGDLAPRARVFCFLGSFTGLFLALSSAPWLGTIVGVGCLIYRKIAGGISHYWLLAVTGGGLLLAAVFLFSNNPWGWIFSHLTLDAGTGYYRLLIWQYAGFDVMQSPIFGLGVKSDWFRPDWVSPSVDSYWLRSAMTFGIPGSALIALSFIGASSRRVRATKRNAGFIGSREARLAEALGIIVFLTLFEGFTVHFWGSCCLIISFLVGVRATLGQLTAR